MRNLAAALAEALGPAPGASGTIDAATSWHTRLALGSAVLDDIEARLESMRGALCLLIDQFEELFRYARETSLEEAKLADRAAVRPGRANRGRPRICS